MNKVIVIGCPGSGKTTFAEKLNKITDIPLFYLDAIWHKPDRTHIPGEEFDKRISEIFSAPMWIIDGNYKRTIEMRLRECDTVFLFDLPTEICLQGVTDRIGKERYDMPWIETELDEEFRQFIENFSEDTLPYIYDLLERYKEGKEIVIFKTREEADEYLKGCCDSIYKNQSETKKGNGINPYLKNLNRIEFVVTMACTGSCKHCSQGEHNSTDSIDKAIAADAVRKIAAEYNIKSVMTFGGEPLLCADTVCAIHKSAAEMNIPERQVITNGFFSRDTDRIYSVAQSLAESGVNEILLSADSFHQETIPLSYVKIFAQAVMKYRIPVKVQPAWLVSADADNIYNAKTREILGEFRKLGIVENEGNVIFPMGNALKYLGEYLEPMKEEENPYWENPRDIRAICFSANGDILGKNVYEKDINEILSEYKG